MDRVRHRLRAPIAWCNRTFRPFSRIRDSREPPWRPDSSRPRSFRSSSVTSPPAIHPWRLPANAWTALSLRRRKNRQREERFVTGAQRMRCAGRNRHQLTALDFALLAPPALSCLPFDHLDQLIAFTTTPSLVPEIPTHVPHP